MSTVSNTENILNHIKIPLHSHWDGKKKVLRLTKPRADENMQQLKSHLWPVGMENYRVLWKTFWLFLFLFFFYLLKRFLFIFEREHEWGVGAEGEADPSSPH